MHFVEQLIFAKKMRNTSLPLIRIQILDLRGNESEREDMKKKLLSLGVDNVFVKPLVDFTLSSEKHVRAVCA